MHFRLQSACVLLPLLFLALRVFSPIQCCSLGPLFRPLEPLLFHIFGRHSAPEIMPSHAVWLLLAFGMRSACMLLHLLFFGASHVSPKLGCDLAPSLAASGTLAFRTFLVSFWPLQSRPTMQSGSYLDFGTRSACMLLHLLICFLLVLHMFPPCWAAI